MKLTLIGNGIMAQSLARGLVKNHEVEIIGRDSSKLKIIQEKIPQVTIKELDENDLTLRRNKVIVDKQFWIDPYGKTHKYDGDLSIDIISFHYVLIHRQTIYLLR